MRDEFARASLKATISRIECKMSSQDSLPSDDGMEVAIELSMQPTDEVEFVRAELVRSKWEELGRRRKDGSSPATPERGIK